MVRSSSLAKGRTARARLPPSPSLKPKPMSVAKDSETEPELIQSKTEVLVNATTKAAARAIKSVIHNPSSQGVVKYTNSMRVLKLATAPQKPWLDHDNSRNPFLFGRNSCHWGQLKLFYTELEFLTLAAAKHDLSKCTVVSVGAAPGHSVALLRRMFPDLEFILIDPAPFVAKVDSHVKIMNTYFTDDTVKTILEDKGVQGRTLLFISDIRITVDDNDGFEEAVFSDMLSQQRWSIDLGAAMSMFKFRLPFADSKTGPRDMRYDYRALKGTGSVSRIASRKGVPLDPKAVPPGTMVYLDGEIRFQLYPPSNSAETRLIVRRSPNGKYMLRAYDYPTYEATMNHFNTVTRCSDFTYPHGAQLAETLAGFDAHSYECASEASIASEYLRVVHGTNSKSLGHNSKSSQLLKPTGGTSKPRDKAKDLAWVLFAIHRDMWQVTQRSVISCGLGTPVAAAKHKDLERQVSRLLRDPAAGTLGTLSGMRQALESAVTQRVSRIKAQLLAFTSLAVQPQAVGLLKKTEYLAQMTWMREELNEISRLHIQYQGILARASFTPHHHGNRHERGHGKR